LSDESFLCNAKPKPAKQTAVCKTRWGHARTSRHREVASSAGKDKREDLKRPLPHRLVIGTTGAVGKPAAPFFRSDWDGM